MSRSAPKKFENAPASYILKSALTSSHHCSQLLSHDSEVSSSQNSKHLAVRDKMFSIEQTKFMSMKNLPLNPSSSQVSESYSTPINRLSLQISEMEDNLIKTERNYIRKIKRLGKKFHKACEMQTSLTQQVVQLRSQLDKYLRAIAQIKQKADKLKPKNEMLGCYSKENRSKSKKRRHRLFQYPPRFNKQ